MINRLAVGHKLTVGRQGSCVLVGCDSNSMIGLRWRRGEGGKLNKLFTGITCYGWAGLSSQSMSSSLVYSVVVDKTLYVLGNPTNQTFLWMGFHEYWAGIEAPGLINTPPQYMPLYRLILSTISRRNYWTMILRVKRTVRYADKNLPSRHFFISSKASDPGQIFLTESWGTNFNVFFSYFNGCPEAVKLAVENHIPTN